LIAWIRHVPDVVAVMVSVAVGPARVHPLALPPDAIAYVVAPEPEPPEVVIDKAWEYGYALVIEVIDVIFSVD
jgi:hypothetical protein